MAKKFEWGKENKCGVIGCDKQIDWGEFNSYLACENHRNLKWGLCEACQNEKTTHAAYYDIYYGDYEAENAIKGAKEGVSFQKEIIENFFTKNISDSLREKLNSAYQKCQEAEKNIPELEKLTQEYWGKKLNYASDFVREKGGQQTNIHEVNLCDNCGDEVNESQQKLKNDYQLNVLNKLIVFDSETSTQIEKEIGKDEAQKISYGFSLASKNKKIEKEQGMVRYHFLKRLPFFGNKNKKYKGQQLQNKKTSFLKLKQYFQNHSIKQIRRIGSNDYFVIWYTDGNVKEKNGSFLPVDWTNFTWNGFKSISLYEINSFLKSLEQEPSPNEKDEETPSSKDNEKKENENSLSDLEKGLIKSYFVKNKIKKITFKDGKLVITHNNNNNNNETITNDQLTNNFEYQLIKDSLERVNKNELSSQELGINSENTSTNTDNSLSGNKYLWLSGGITVGIMASAILFFTFRRKKKKNN